MPSSSPTRSREGRPSPQDARLSSTARCAWGAANLLFGALPCLLFFAWIERGCALPWLPLRLGWPWARMEGAPLAARAAFDLALYAAFALGHSGLAQRGPQAWLLGFLPPQAVRVFYLVITGLSLFLLMAFWQGTGIVVWALPVDFGWNALLSLLVYYPILGMALIPLSRFGLALFFGFEQLSMRAGDVGRTAGSSKLATDGLFSVVRHPVYAFTLAACLFAPVMTGDRALVFLFTCAYLAVGVPIEEKKLLAIFGEEYARYRERVPAVVPRLGSLAAIAARRNASRARGSTRAEAR